MKRTRALASATPLALPAAPRRSRRCGRAHRWLAPMICVLAALAQRAIASAAPTSGSGVTSGLDPAAGASSSAPPLERVSLAQALARAAASNPDVAVAGLEIEKAEGLLTQARGAERPDLSGNGTYTRLDHDRFSNGIRTGAVNQWSANLALSVPLLVPTTWAGVHRATSARNLSRTRAEDTRRELAATVARAYLAVLLERRQIEVAERSRDTARAHFEFAHTRLAGGIGNRLDDVRAEQLLRAEESSVATARVALTRAQAALGTVVGGERSLDAADDVALPAPGAMDLDAATEEARRSRADLRVLQSQLASARRAHADVWTLYAPFVAGNALAFVQDLGTTLQPTRGWQAQLMLTLPIYDGGVRPGIERERSASEAEAQVQLDAALRVAAVEIRAAFDVMSRADEALTSAREAARLAELAAELANLAYRGGATTNLEVIDAERRAHDAESQVAISEEAAREARLGMLLATGKFP